MNLDAVNLDALKPLIPLPIVVKLVALVAILALLCVGYYFSLWVPMQDDIVKKKSDVERQRIVLQKNQKLARDIPKKKEEYENLQVQLKIALNMLPRQSQIPDLLESVTWAGKDSGLTFTTFKPVKESTKSIYAEVPVELKVSGSYKQLLSFLKRVGELPRIVNVVDMNIEAPKDDSGDLTVTGKAITYRFVEEESKKPVSRKVKKKK